MLGGIPILVADGSVWLVEEAIGPKVREAGATISGGGSAEIDAGNDVRPLFGRETIKAGALGRLLLGRLLCGRVGKGRRDDEKGWKGAAAVWYHGPGQRRISSGIAWRGQTSMADGVRVQVTAKGPQPQQTWSRMLREGQVARIGRQPAHGWAIPWDEQLAAEQVELTLEDGRVTVRRLPEAPPIVWLGDEPADEFIVGIGGEFRIGKTTLRIENAPADKPNSHTGRGGRSHMFGKYHILKMLGAGGMGRVYLARDTQNNRQVALKILDPEKSRVPTFVRRFQSEAEAASHLHHENIVSIYESGTIDGKLFMALEYVDGIDVERLLDRKGPLSVRRSLDIIKQVARALQHAYEQGIVHRDIKPSNLMITREGVVKLTDMGLARSMDDAEKTGITRAGTTVGTVDYMSPEQARNSKAADT
ncbi:MAG TPA: serine/threonine protein kinase, partial [Planctomycetaceae bacterium]|nr:serine/threonine protein kinase [Planctomycetaceae bacterium]